MAVAYKKVCSLLVFIFLFCLFCELNSAVGCIREERKALLELKESFQDPSGSLSSWVGDECCNWTGVRCYSLTGHVTDLYLFNKNLSGTLNASLLNLKYLSFLGLCSIDFGWNSIPSFIGSLKNLEYLYLSDSCFSGMIPPHLGNLSHLRDLSINQMACPRGGLWVEDLHWLSGLSSLNSLDLDSVNLSKASDHWVQVVNTLPSLSGLYLNGCSLKEISPSLPSVNITSLEDLYISSNHFESSSIPQWFSNLTSLQHLTISNSGLQGPISEVRIPCNLQILDLRANEICGDIQPFLETFSKCTNNSLRELYLVSNKISGKLPENLTSLEHLEGLHLYQNLISGTIPISIGNLSSLVELDLSYNKLQSPIPYSIFQLTRLYFLHLYNNQLSGKLPPLVDFHRYIDVVLDDNQLEGSLPVWSNVTVLSLKNNRFSGTFPSNFLHRMSVLEYLDLSGNLLNGSLPVSMHKLKNLRWLYLSNNSLSGKLHTSWKGLKNLTVIDLSKNNLAGSLPSSICSQLPSLLWLRLSGNNLFGNFSSLKDCKGLWTLDLGENKFSGSIPEWIAETMPSLHELTLRANAFSGTIPEQLCQLSYLHVLELAVNNFSGSIPHCIGNLSAIMKSDPLEFEANLALELVMKGRLMLLENVIVGLVNSIDLSANYLSGRIPEGITNLTQLVTLNLSWNQLIGPIPESIGSLKQLETLDLSLNHLSGFLPHSMVSMTSLNSLNLSYNNFTGLIPRGNQFNTFNDPSIFEGNSRLCGLPLNNSCSIAGDGDSNHEGDKAEGEEEGDHETFWFYLTIAFGFATGFWAVCGSLVISRSWRHAYFGFVDRKKDDLLVATGLLMARLRRKLENERH